VSPRLLTEDATQEYRQGIGCLLHLPRGDPGRGGECGKETLGILAGCQAEPT
jgi:hypothetical protein